MARLAVLTGIDCESLHKTVMTMKTSSQLGSWHCLIATFFSLSFYWAFSQTSRADVQMAWLDSHQVIMCFHGQVERIDTATGIGVVIAPADLFAFDRATREVLEIRHVPEGSELVAQSLESGATNRRGLLRLNVVNATWTGEAGGYCIGAVPLRSEAGDVAFGTCFGIAADRNKWISSPLPTLAEISLLPSNSTLLWNPSSVGSFSISTWVNHPDLSLRNARRIGNETPSRKWVFVIAKDWKPWLYWPIESAISSAPVAYSTSGRNLVAALRPADRSESRRYVNIDLQSGETRAIDWLYPDMEPPLVMRGDLKEALWLVQKPPNDVQVDVLTPLVVQADKLAKSRGIEGTQQWMLVSLGETHPPLVVNVFADEPKLMGISDESAITVTDGTRLWRIIDGKMTETKKIQMEPAR
jgi:hypothetical protein